jgi:cytochrome c oxidase subunit III
MPDSALSPTIESNGTSGAGNGGASSANGQGGGGPFGAERVPRRIYMTGMMIALGAILMFFVALASASIVRRGLGNNDWQPFELPRILWLNTLILIASSVTLARSRRSLLAQKVEQFRHWWGVTTALGLFFLVGQVIAWRQLASAGVFLATSPNSGFFYVFTMAHGLHLLGGIAALLAVAFWPGGVALRNTATKVAALYWHSMDVLWVFVFLFLVMTN